MAMYLLSSHKKGISSCQLMRDINVTQTTAWYMLQRLRTLYSQNDEKALDGIVECDELYLGGREKNKHECKKTEGTQGRSTKTKTPIFGMVERKGDAKATTLRTYIKQFLSDNAVIMTDESQSYEWLDGEGYTHYAVTHGAGQYAVGLLSTNVIEGFWAQFKRMVFGYITMFPRSTCRGMLTRRCIGGTQGTGQLGTGLPTCSGNPLVC